VLQEERALTKIVTWDATKITSVDWRTYPPLYLGAELPSSRACSSTVPTGARPAAARRITLVAGAIGNAIFDATGARIREAPFTPARVKAALAVRG